MNVMTQQNQQAQLHDFYNQANQAFQAGDYALALKSLEQALQYAETDKQVAHIQSSIRTVQEMIPQEPVGPVQGSYQGEEAQAMEEAPTPQGSNRMLLLTVLVGLICLTPIVMKCIEIFTQPSTKTEQVQTATTTTQSATQNTAPASPQAAAPVAGAPASPASTPDVIVDNTAPAAKATVTGSGINLRASASTKAAALTKLSAGESVDVIEADSQQADGYTWSKIKTASGTEGWVANKFLQAAAPASNVAPPASPADPNAVAPASPAANTAVTSGTPRNIASDGVSLRASAGTKGALITVLSKSQITVLPDAPIQADGFNWVKIRTERGTEGWVADKFLGQ